MIILAYFTEFYFCQAKNSLETQVLSLDGDLKAAREQTQKTKEEKVDSVMNSKFLNLQKKDPAYIL